MPRLHAYKNRSGKYIASSVFGNSCTFQLTKNGEDKLQSLGIRSNQNFDRKIFFQLHAEGDAYTSATGVPSLKPTASQSSFPACDYCKESFSKINLFIEDESNNIPKGKIICFNCFLENNVPENSLIRLHIRDESNTNSKIKKRLEKLGKEDKSENVHKLEALLDIIHQSSTPLVAAVKSQDSDDADSVASENEPAPVQEPQNPSDKTTVPLPALSGSDFGDIYHDGAPPADPILSKTEPPPPAKPVGCLSIVICWTAIVGIIWLYLYSR